MIKFIWRETLLSIVAFSGLCAILAVIMFVLINPNPEKIIKTLPAIMGFIVAGITAFIYLRTLGISKADFVELLKHNGFEAQYGVDRQLGIRFPAFSGLRNDGILLYACLDFQYTPAMEDLLRGVGNGSNKFHYYFPCKSPPTINHNIVKLGNKVEIGHGIYVSRDRGAIRNTDTDIKKIISEMCADIDFLVINDLRSGPGFVYIAAGPSSLTYGEYAKKNVQAVLKFINVFRTYYGCQNEKWDRQIDMNNLKENIDALNKEFVHSLRENHKGRQ